MEAKFWVSSEFRLLLGTYRYVKFTFQSNLFENTDSTGRFTMYASNVVLNVVLVEYSTVWSAVQRFPSIRFSSSKNFLSEKFHLIIMSN